MMQKVNFLFCLLLSSFFVTGRNILLIVVDDLRPTLGIYGEKNAAYSPNIDKLAKESILFHHAYAQQALCAPSRNSFLTSRLPDTLRLFDFYSYWRNSVGNYTTIPQYFKDNSYETFSIGKIFHPGASSNFTDDFPLSWSHIPWHPPTEVYKDSPVCYNQNKWSRNLVCPVRLLEQPKHTLPDIESTEKAKEYILTKKLDDRPFFLAVGLHKPHIPLTFPRKYLDYYPLHKIQLPAYKNYPPDLPSSAWTPWCDVRKRDDIAALNLTFPYEQLPDKWIKLVRQGYSAAVTYIDELIGELLLSLEKAQLKKDTIVALIGDHGWSLGEHGEWSKYSNYDVSVRVPFILRVPNLTFKHTQKKEVVSSGYHCKEVVELIDIFPTLVDLAGLQSIETCRNNYSKLCTEGKSLVPLIKAEVTGSLRNKSLSSFIYIAFSQYPRPGEFPTCTTPNSDEPRLKDIRIMGYSMRTKTHRYTEWVSWDHHSFTPLWSEVKGIELYDHRIDNEENLNLAGRLGLEKLQKKLRKMLRKHFSY